MKPDVTIVGMFDLLSCTLAPDHILSIHLVLLCGFDIVDLALHLLLVAFEMTVHLVFDLT